MTTPTIVVTGFIQVATKDRDGFLAVLHDHVPRVRRKDGCIAYASAVDAPDPNLLRMSEVWRDLAALNAHLADDEFKGTLASLAGLEVTARSVQRYEVTSTTDIYRRPVIGKGMQKVRSPLGFLSGHQGRACPTHDRLGQGAGTGRQ